ncbi:hypothetical protein ACJMK2_004483, partial [Sinanodonta woodiana]
DQFGNSYYSVWQHSVKFVDITNTKMMRDLVIIILIGLCFAYAANPAGETFTDAGVDDPLVREVAQHVLTASAEERWRRCNGASV